MLGDVFSPRPRQGNSGGQVWSLQLSVMEIQRLLDKLFPSSLEHGRNRNENRQSWYNNCKHSLSLNFRSSRITEIKGKKSRLRNVKQHIPTKIIPKLEKAFMYELVCKKLMHYPSQANCWLFFQFWILWSLTLGENVCWNLLYFYQTFNYPTGILFTASILGWVLEVQFPLTLMMCACCEDNYNPFAD